MRTTSPVSVDHNLTLLSADPDTKNLVQTESQYHSVRTTSPVYVGGPKLGAPIDRPRHDKLAISTECNTVDLPIVTHEHGALPKFHMRHVRIAQISVIQAGRREIRPPQTRMGEINMGENSTAQVRKKLGATFSRVNRKNGPQRCIYTKDHSDQK